MVSGPDIITYVGVPLAVLGVLPIIYNTVSTLLSLTKVRRALRHGRLQGIARGDVINHVIEVELPRYTIAPLDRHEQCKDYWRLCDFPSTIPGGTWTIFNWKQHSTSSKTQRIDYSDQLRQPQAEIGFEELVSFLLDLGAVPDPVGFRMLRGSGLWVPTGTPLLLSPDRHESVLTIASLDDSDGMLSLAVRWSSNWGSRDSTSLPPYWVLVRGALSNSPPTSSSTLQREFENVTKTAGDVDKVETGHTRKDQAAKDPTPKAEEQSPAIRCRIGLTGLQEAIPDDFDAQMFSPLTIAHLAISDPEISRPGLWFASIVTALSTTTQTLLHTYSIPLPILQFAKLPTIPCGVLVLLSFVAESETPEWATKYTLDEEEEREKQFRIMRDEGRAVMAEMRMQGEEKARAFRERQMKKHDDWVQGLNETRRRDAQRAETRTIEALSSPKWDNTLIAQHMLAWLKRENLVDEQHDSKRAVEVLLWRMVNESALANEIAEVLDLWKTFVDTGGMKRVDYESLKDKQVLFAQAVLMMAIVKESVTVANGSLAQDLQECLRVWKKVRLG